jgi:hypothetical protein
MKLRFYCSHCGNEITVRYLNIGDVAKCRSCGLDTLILKDAEFIEGDSSAAPGAQSTPVENNSPSIAKIITNPFIDIWLNPRETILKVIEEKRFLMAMVFCAMFGIVYNLYAAAQNAHIMKSGIPIWQIVWTNIVFGIPFGLAYLFIMSFGITWLCRLFGGKGSYKNGTIALGWSFIPYGISLIIIPLMLMFPGGFKYEEAGVIHTGGILIFLAFVMLILVAWVLVISVNAVSVAYSLSNGKSFIVLFLWGLIAFLLIIGVSMLVFQYYNLFQLKLPG